MYRRPGECILLKEDDRCRRCICDTRGVDTHVHLDQPIFGALGDKLETGTRSAIAGGTTTLVCFAYQEKRDESVLPIVKAYHKKARTPNDTIWPVLTRKGCGSHILRLWGSHDSLEPHKINR
jgi:hypothetical protein